MERNLSEFTFPEEGVTPENFDETFERFKEYEAARHAYDAQARFLRGLWPIIQ